MGMIVLAGRQANLLARGTVTVTNENTFFPKGKLWDGDPGEVFQFATAGTDRDVILDADITLGTGDFEAAHVSGAPPGWTNASTGTGSLARDTTIFDSGTSSCRMNSGAAGRGILQRDFVVRAGESLFLSFRMRSDGSNVTYAELRDLDTGQYLHPDNTWQDAQNTFRTVISSSFSTETKTLVITPMSAWPKPLRTIRLRFLSEASVANAQGWVDTLTFFPLYDTLGIFGHNVRPALPLLWQSDDNSSFSSPTTLATITPKRDKLYHRLSSLATERYTRLRASSALFVPDPIWYGEVLIGASRLFTRMASRPIVTDHIDHRVSVPRFMGGTAARGLARSPRGPKSLVFEFPDTPAAAESGLWRDWHNEMFLRSLGGHPALIVPTDARAEVLFCRLPERVRESDGAADRREGFRSTDPVELDELPLPVELP